MFSPDLLLSPLALWALATFGIAYALVISDEFTHLSKSKPVILGASIIWSLIALLGQQNGVGPQVTEALRHNFLEYAELLLFLMVAMTYINALESRGVFSSIQSILVRHRFSYPALFWITGLLGFCLSGIADNLTTALVMCAVILSVGKKNQRFVNLACVNVVVAVNAGGAFSPFGDVTTLMVWQKNILPFFDFFKLFIPSLVSFLVPTALIALFVPKGIPESSGELQKIQKGGIAIAVLFLFTIALTVFMHYQLHLPPVLGMMTGLGFLQLYGNILKYQRPLYPFQFFAQIERIEWDTLLFFYGIMLCVGGLATLGYLELLNTTFYHKWILTGFGAGFEQTPANVAVGLISAIVDNIPVMYAVLNMMPAMSDGQWLLVTLTAGIGGSLLSIGSAAGVALMGQAKGSYTFFGHLKWTWAILLGYFLGVGAHLWINRGLF